MKTLTKTMVAAAAAAALGMGTASAALIDNAPITYGPVALNFTSAIDYPGFVPPDPSCVLEKVHVRITGELSGFLGIENLSTLYSVEKYFIQTIGTFKATLNAVDYSTFVSSPALDEAANSHGPLDPYDGTLNYAGVSGDSITYTAVTDFTDHTLDSPADLAYFTNPTVSVSVKGSRSLVKYVESDAPELNTVDRATSRGSITIDIDYEYRCDVPDDSVSMVGAVVGMLGLVEIRRRMKK